MATSFTLNELCKDGSKKQHHGNSFQICRSNDLKTDKLTDKKGHSPSSVQGFPTENPRENNLPATPTFDACHESKSVPLIRKEFITLRKNVLSCAADLRPQNFFSLDVESPQFLNIGNISKAGVQESDETSETALLQRKFRASKYQNFLPSTPEFSYVKQVPRIEANKEEEEFISNESKRIKFDGLIPEALHLPTL